MNDPRPPREPPAAPFVLLPHLRGRVREPAESALRITPEALAMWDARAAAAGLPADWRLPDGAIWLLLIGLGLMVSGLAGWGPTAWTLLAVTGLGYCAQGIAVVESVLLARGLSPSIIALTMFFVFLMAAPVFVVATVSVGLSDVWLDIRRLESVPDGDSS